jgi:hypothetical protein
MDDYTQEIQAGLKRMDIPWNVENGGTHDKLILDVHGKTVKFPIAKTSSDHRAAKNALADIRRLVGYEVAPVDFVKISRTVGGGYPSGSIRISFPRAVLAKMFPQSAPKAVECRFDANFNKTSKILLITPMKDGRRNLSWRDNSGKNPDSLIAVQSLSNKEFGLGIARQKGEQYKLTWLANNSFSIKLPDEWWDESDDAVLRSVLPKGYTAMVAKTPMAIDKNADAKTLVEMVNTILTNDPELRCHSSEDGRSIKMTRRVVVEQEI